MTETTETTETTTQSTEAASTAASAASGIAPGTAPGAAATEAASAGENGKPGADSGTAAAKTGTEAAPAGTIPEKYDLKVPDGATVDADFVTRTAATARALGLTNEAGQKLLDAQIAELATARTAAIEAGKAEQLKAMQPGGAIWAEQEAAWRAKALTDAEIGGSPEKLQANVDLAVKVVNRFAPDEAKQFFTDSGLGSHPALVRMFARIGKAMSEATLTAPGAGASAATTADARLAKMYPTMVPKS